MIADLEPPKDNPNAPYVLTEQSPRYRTPFTKETAKEYGRKGGLTRGQQMTALARNARHIKAIERAAMQPIQPKLDALRRSQRRFLAQAVAENDAKKQALFMRSFQVAFDAEQTLLGQSHKSTKKPHLAHVSPSAKIEPLPSTISSSPVDQSASKVKPDAKNLDVEQVSADKAGSATKGSTDPHTS